ncbi:glycosyltransferase [Maridesulfovibrio ferrireducens]|uniref:glycosyltransferase n=1 Tax=Maridesulfovibrio ferrireducens TaxID=246191 RepID=UPI001A2168C9|nr:glycosyltransferase [Maridesulfovibrio ferrireducens]MBI9113162.1 glycosyltransferase [Maridesulfovibrio ferrireducens]
MDEKKLVSFIVITRNRVNERLNNCLAALRSQNFSPENIEIVLLDYGSDIETQKQLQLLAKSFDARYVYVDESGAWNRGRAINLGCQAALGELLAISDIDMIHGPDYAAEAWQRYVELGRGAFYGKGIPWDLPERLKVSQDEVCTEFAALKQRSTARPRGMGNVVFSRATFDDLRGWEEEYLVWGCEDSDFNDRAKRSGAFCVEITAGLLHQWHEVHDSSAEARRSIGFNRVMYLGCVGRTPVARTGSFGNIYPLATHKAFQAPSLSLVLMGVNNATQVAPTLASINGGMYPVSEIILAGFSGDIGTLQPLCDFPLRAIPHHEMDPIVSFLKSEVRTDVLGFLPAGFSFGEYFLVYECLGKLLSGAHDVDGFFWWDAKGYDLNHQILPAFESTPSIMSSQTHPVCEEGSSGLLEDSLSFVGWQDKYSLYCPVFEGVQELRPIKNPKCSVVVISWVFHPDSERTLAELASQLEPSCQILLVDNGCSPGELDALLPYVHTLVRMRENTGAYLARNVGALFALSSVLIFLDDDGIPGKNYAQEHLKAHETHGIVSARGAVLPKTDNPLNALARHYNLGHTPFPIFADIEGNTSYKASAFFVVGGWDDSIRFGGGGVDLALRLLRAYPDWGCQIYWPTATIRHDYSSSEDALEVKRVKQEASRRNMEAKFPGYRNAMEAWSVTKGRTDAICSVSDMQLPVAGWRERTLEQVMAEADLTLARRLQDAGDKNTALILLQRANLFLEKRRTENGNASQVLEKSSNFPKRNNLIKEKLIEQAHNLETAVAKAIETGTRPKRLLEAVVEFLTYHGESAIMAGWVKDSQMAEGKIVAPHDGAPVVSVVVPCHNYGRYLAECVKSVLLQSFCAWEIIIVNDGSTDDTHEVAQDIMANYPGHAIRYYRQEQKGIVQPRNRGVTLAKGEFILPLDADDLIAPTFLERTVAYLLERPELGYVSTKALFFGSSNKIWPSEPFANLSLLVTNQQTNTTLYRKTMWQDVNGYDERMIHGYMDWEFWIHCTKMGWTGEQINEPLFFYRRKDDSVVMRAKQRDIAIKEQIVDLHSDIYDPSKLASVRHEMGVNNWIPADLIRNPLRIRKRGVDSDIKGAPNAVSVSENPKGHIQDDAGKRQVLDVLNQVLPELCTFFKRPEAGCGIPSEFQSMLKRLSSKVQSLLVHDKGENALEIAALLLAYYPLEPAAIMLLLQTLSSSGHIAQALILAKFYIELFPDQRDMKSFLAKVLHGWASVEVDPLHALGLLDGAALLDPGNNDILTDFWAKFRQLGLTRKDSPPATVWYVTNSFGYGVGGVNGVTEAKSMTLSSILRGPNGPEVCILTPLRPGLPEAVAEFAKHLGNVCGAGNFRWPHWVGTTAQGVGTSVKAGTSLLNGTCRLVRPLESQPDCVIVEGVRLEADIYLKSLGLTTDCPRVYVHHTSPDQFSDKYTDIDMMSEALKAFADYDNFVCVSANVIEEWRRFEELADKNWVYIPNCAREEEAEQLLSYDKLDLRQALDLPPDAFVVLCLASVQTRKGQDILLNQIAEVLHHLPNAYFLFVGPILSQWGGREILDTARKFFSIDQVRFLGARRNALEYLRAADCLVLPSREEALPLTILEAMVLAKPCVASDVNGIPELVEHESSGLLFSHSVPRDLAKHLIRLGQDSSLAKKMGLQARQRYLDFFSRRLHSARWNEVLKKIILNGGDWAL